jgi:hypothetical protein
MEPSGNIDLSDPSYQYADFYANALSASTLSGIGNITLYSTSVNSRLIELETKSGSIDNSILILNQFTASVTASLEKIYQTTSSLNNATASLYTSASLMTASIVSLTSSVVALQDFSGNVNSRFTTLGTYTGSIDSRFTTLGTYTGSIETRLTEIGVVTGSLISSASLVSSSVWNLHQFSSSQLTQNSTLGIYTSSIDTRMTEIGIVTGSLISSASLVSSSVWNVNQFTSSTSQSLWLLNSASANHEDRIDYIEGIAFGGIDLNAQFATLAIVTSSLQVATSSIQSFTSSANVRLNNLESYTSSLKTAISLNGSNVTILGDLNVQGTTTVIETTTLQVKDNIVELNYGGTSTTAGIITKDATGASTTSGSLLWNSTDDIWTAGKLGSEAKVLTDGMGVISGSSQINVSSTTGDIVLGTRTSGSYVASLVAGNGISLSNNSGENATPTITNTGILQVSSGTGVSVTGDNTNLTVSIGQQVATGASPTFAGLTINGAITATGDITAYFTSDERLKENIQPITNALSKVENISGNEYDWKEGFEEIHTKKGNDVGVIAQEIQKILPQAVIERDNGYFGVSYEKIVPLLIEAIKELSAKVKELENK